LDRIPTRITEIKENLETNDIKEEVEMSKDTGRAAVSRIGDKLMNSKDRLQDMTRMANESDDLTRNMNVTLQKDKENLELYRIRRFSKNGSRRR